MKINNVFLWNLYVVEISNHGPMNVCAPSMIGALKRAKCFIESLDTKDSHEIVLIKFIHPCLN